MNHLPNLFKLIQLTRAQIQQGYLLSGIKREEISNLAEHHYLVTFIGWQLAKYLNSKGANIDVLKVVEFCLIHDLGELFGGDIAMPYARINKKALKHAKLFEEENQKFLSKFFGDESKNFKKLGKEILDAKSDECVVAKVADYIECMQYKEYVKNISTKDKAITKEKLQKFIKRAKDPVVKKELLNFVDYWLKNISKSSTLDILGYK